MRRGEANLFRGDVAGGWRARQGRAGDEPPLCPNVRHKPDAVVATMEASLTVFPCQNADQNGYIDHWLIG
jgi:hypothetical protein